MSYPGQVFEDPEYYDDHDFNYEAVPELLTEEDDELEDPTNFIAVIESFDPHNTVNS